MSYTVITFPTELSSLLASASAGMPRAFWPFVNGWACPQRMKSLQIVSGEKMSR